MELIYAAWRTVSVEGHFAGYERVSQWKYPGLVIWRGINSEFRERIAEVEANVHAA